MSGGGGNNGYDSLQVQHLLQRVAMLEQMFALQQQTNEALLRALNQGQPQQHHQHQHQHQRPMAATAGCRPQSPRYGGDDDDVHVVMVDDRGDSMLLGGSSSGAAPTTTGGMARRAAT